MVKHGIRAGLDVFHDDLRPMAMEAGHLSLEGVYGTHHIGASTQQARKLPGRHAESSWNGSTPGRHRIASTLRVDPRPTSWWFAMTKVGVPAGVLDLLREASVNVQQMENVIYAGDGAAACARIQVVGSMTDEVIAR